MRQLVLCGRCRRQLDAGERQPGESVVCVCGAVVAVPALTPHDSAVVRCAACGAPRQDAEAACRFCGSSFTVHELDLDTICPHCMARVAGSSRFCDHCGGPVLVAQAAAAGAALRCPVCAGGGGGGVGGDAGGDDGERLLASRRLGGEPVAVAACDRCGGVWVDTQVFETLVARARHAELGGRNGWPGAAVAPGGGAPAGAAPLTPGAAAALGRGRLYLPCALCGKLMNRINFGRKSGVIVDVCRAHGLWFDLDELPRVLSWVESGGEDRARRLAAEEAQAAARERHLAEGDHPPEGWLHGTAEPHGWGGILDLLDSSLHGLFRHWDRF